MRKEIVSSEIVTVVGPYGIVKCVEQLYFDDGRKCGRRQVVYDVCLGGGIGDIVYSCEKLDEALKWAKES